MTNNLTTSSYVRLLNFIPLVRKQYAEWNKETPSAFFKEHKILNEFLSSFFKLDFILRKKNTLPDFTISTSYLFNKKNTSSDEEIAKTV